METEHEIHLFQHRSNEITSSIIHLIGVAMGIVILCVLLALATGRTGAVHIAGYAIYGACMILLYAASATFHLIPNRFL